MSKAIVITEGTGRNEIANAFKEAGYSEDHILISWTVDDLIDYLEREEYKEDPITLDIPILVEKVKRRLTHCTIRETVLDQFSEAIESSIP